MTYLAAKVGILLRTKNRNVTLERALRGIVRQTVGGWHIHLLNDGGNIDEVRSTVEKYAAQLDGKITIYNNKNSVGRGGALVQILENASERYVLMHDDDDTIEPDFLKVTVPFLEDEKNANCAAVVTSNYDVYAELVDDEVKIKNIVDTQGKKERSYIDIMSFVGAEFGQFPPIACLFKRKDAMPYIHHIKNMPYHEDKALFSYMLLNGEFATIEDQVASYYHYESKDKDYFQTSYMNKKSGIVEINNWFRDYMNNKNEMSRFICLLQSERQKNDYLCQLLITSHNEIMKNISSTKEENKQIMNLLIKVIQGNQRRV